MREYVIDTLIGYTVLSLITFVPILIGVWIYKKFNGKENQKADALACMLILSGFVFGIYWLLITTAFTISLITNPIDKEKVSSLLQLLR